MKVLYLIFLNSCALMLTAFGGCFTSAGAYFQVLWHRAAMQYDEQHTKSTPNNSETKTPNLRVVGKDLN